MLMYNAKEFNYSVYRDTTDSTVFTTDVTELEQAIEYDVVFTFAELLTEIYENAYVRLYEKYDLEDLYKTILKDDIATLCNMSINQTHEIAGQTLTKIVTNDNIVLFIDLNQYHEVNFEI